MSSSRSSKSISSRSSSSANAQRAPQVAPVTSPESSSASDSESESESDSPVDESSVRHQLQLLARKRQRSRVQRPTHTTGQDEDEDNEEEDSNSSSSEPIRATPAAATTSEAVIEPPFKKRRGILGSLASTASSSSAGAGGGGSIFRPFQRVTVRRRKLGQTNDDSDQEEADDEFKPEDEKSNSDDTSESDASGSEDEKRSRRSTRSQSSRSSVVKSKPISRTSSLTSASSHQSNLPNHASPIKKNSFPMKSTRPTRATNSDDDDDKNGRLSSSDDDLDDAFQRTSTIMMNSKRPLSKISAPTNSTHTTPHLLAAQPLVQPTMAELELESRYASQQLQQRAPVEPGLNIRQIIEQCIRGELPIHQPHSYAMQSSVSNPSSLSSHDLMPTQHIAESQDQSDRIQPLDQRDDMIQIHESQLAPKRTLSNTSSSILADRPSAQVPLLDDEDDDEDDDDLMLTRTLGASHSPHEVHRSSELFYIRQLQLYILRFRHVVRLQVSHDQENASQPPEDGEEDEADEAEAESDANASNADDDDVAGSVEEESKEAHPSLNDDVAPMEIDDSDSSPPIAAAHPPSNAAEPNPAPEANMGEGTNVSHESPSSPASSAISPAPAPALSRELAPTDIDPNLLFMNLRRDYSHRKTTMATEPCLIMLYRALKEYLKPIIQLLIVIKNQRQTLLKKQRAKERREQIKLSKAKKNQPTSRAIADDDEEMIATNIVSSTATIATDAAAAASTSPTSAQPAAKSSSALRHEMAEVGSITVDDIHDVLKLLDRPSSLPSLGELEPIAPIKVKLESGLEEVAGQTASTAAASADSTDVIDLTSQSDPVSSTSTKSLSNLTVGRKASAKAVSSVRGRSFFTPEQKAVMIQALEEGRCSHRLEHAQAREELAQQLSRMSSKGGAAESSSHEDESKEFVNGDLNLSSVTPSPSKKKKKKPYRSTLRQMSQVNSDQVRSFLLNYAARLKKRAPTKAAKFMKDMAERGNCKPNSGKKAEEEKTRKRKRTSEKVNIIPLTMIDEEDEDQPTSDAPASSIGPDNYVRWEDLTDEQKAQLEAEPSGTLPNEPTSTKKAKKSRPASGDSDASDMNDASSAAGDRDPDQDQASDSSDDRRARKRAKKLAKKQRKAEKRAKKHARRERKKVVAAAAAAEAEVRTEEHEDQSSQSSSDEESERSDEY